MFKLVSKFKATGDQPTAIAELSKNIASGVPHQVLLGVTGSGKTATMSWVIEKAQRPTLVISPNKTLAAQLYQEFKDFFPESGVHYFVSYYDYYQPEAYIPQTDTYIQKDAKVNETIDRMRHEAVQDLVARKDVIVVASVSCIYNIGSPEEYQEVSLEITKGQKITRRELLSHLTSLQYQRNDIDLAPGSCRARGEVVEFAPSTGKEVIRVEFSKDAIDRISRGDVSPSPRFEEILRYRVFPAKFWVTPENKLKLAVLNIRKELEERLVELKGEGRLLEAERLEQRTLYDLEMIEEAGYCHGVENYSSHLEFRAPGEPPYTLLDYLGDDFLCFIDESHLTLPQIRAMSAQDRVRKESLITHGFRLPSAMDNRPLTSEEFFKRAPQIVYVSATPANFEKEISDPYIAEQIIRPTGLVEPEIEIRPTVNQMQDAIEEIAKVTLQGQRSLLITLTKRLAEDITEYLAQRGMKVQWLHSEIKTLERPTILEKLRRGEFDVIVGINLLREGLDLPEVTRVLILDADKEGFLRNETTLIQTMGRAARHTEGKAILYADKMTGSIKNAIVEVNRRRKIQLAYNKKHGITPQAIVKEIKTWELGEKKLAVVSELEDITDAKLLEREMKEAASNLDFERAAAIRDLLKKRKGGTQ
ncbi:MAG: excinuclease ABC subunit UvrB [bacterium]|nr:excinuclease ABC subunit UvrB [bacterium]